MVQKRPFGEEESYEVSCKQPRHEPSYQLVSVLELSRESVGVEAYGSGGDEDNPSRIIPDANKKPDSHNVAEVLFTSEKETEMGIHGSPSISSWPTSSTSEEDIRPEAPFHILTSPEYYYFDHPFRAAAHHREINSSPLSNPQKMVPIGPDFQAELPEWCAYSNKDKPCIEGSIRCVLLHIIEAREKLKLTLGEEAFVRLGFCDMGEVVAKKWSEEEEELFHEVVLSNPPPLGKNFWNHLAVETDDPLNIDSDNDEWHETVDDADEGANMTDEDEDSVVESPAYHNDLSYKMIHEEHDSRIYDKDVGDATSEDYKPVNFGSRKNQGLSNKVVEQEVKGGSCTIDAAGVTSEPSLGKTNNDKHWAIDIAGMGNGTKQHSLLEPCSGKEWDVGYLSCARNEVDLLPTHTMIEEVFGDGAWLYKSRDG
ncbi:hypothetical protein RND71_017522 [Anisodus tanguticus]|uniref:Uncharacterized protein n=1 Tax=Anisodus tanguticus TaxID=243964 RepID=A0AAE1S2G6_9SOLA|nr:hypothetical protein RND71_017522 [Anisodus tanguticus]